MSAQKKLHPKKPEAILVIVSLLMILLFPPLGVLIAFGVVMIYLLAGADRRKRFESIGFRGEGSKLKLLLLSLALGIVIELTFQIVVNPLIEQLFAARVDLSAYDFMRGNLQGYLMILAVGWLVGGFIEEILFRGFLLTRISGWFSHSGIGNFVAVAATSAAFGFSHLYQGWSGVVSTGLIAIIFGMLFIRQKKILWYPILTHGFVNTTSITLMYLNYDLVLRDLLF